MIGYNQWLLSQLVVERSHCQVSGQSLAPGMYERWLDRIIGDKLQDILGQNMVIFAGKTWRFSIIFHQTCWFSAKKHADFP